MRANIIQIGNSKGIRIPSVILKGLNIGKEVELGVQDGILLVNPITKKPRAGWERKFKEMARCGDDRLVIGEPVDVKSFKWEW